MVDTGVPLVRLRSQIATSNRGGRRYLPMAFTEQGAIMAASVLNSDRAVEMPHCAGNWLLWNYRNATLCRSALKQRLSTG